VGVGIRAATRGPDGTSTPQAAPHAGSSPTPEPAHGRCANATRNVADGPDAWGGCFPGPSNTGVPDGTALTEYTGPCRITQDDTLIDAKKVDCVLDIAADNVRIKRSSINGGVLNDVPIAGSFSIEDSTVDAGSVHLPEVAGERALCCQRFTALRVEMRRGYSGAWCEYYCTIRESWIHAGDTDEGGSAHESGVRQGSGKTRRAQSFIHNTIGCVAGIVDPDGGCSADVTGYGNFDTIRNNYLYRNLLEHTPSGGYCAYGGSTATPHPDGASNEWIGNIFQRGRNGKCGVYGPTTDFAVGVRGNVFEHNRWDTGEPIRDPDAPAAGN
jgi:hypothetical protein